MPPRNTTILVIEDDPKLRDLYRTILSAHGYAVVAVEDGIDALQRIDQGLSPAAVVLDLALPRLNGLDVQRELQAHSAHRRVPVVVVTGTDIAVDGGNFACVLRKPITSDQLLQAVAACLRGTR